ncbi:MAG: zinc ribbon domain-containing protein [Pirellulales bacterium]|nr:zinc ribbon domain-containing protein [Pirellulales bacterium]
MPTYEYECDQCGERFEKFQNMKDAPVKTCPTCGSPVRRLIGPGAAIIFKGSGFYATDYGRGTSRCGRGTPCCGRDTPCDRPPCDK